MTTGTHAHARPLPPLPEQPPRPVSSSAASTDGSYTAAASAAAPANGARLGDSNLESAPLETDVPPVGGGAPEGARLRASGARLARCLLTNHVLWGIAVGFVLSLSEVGTKWLDPGKGAVVVGDKAVYMPNEDFVEELGFIDQVHLTVLCCAVLTCAASRCAVLRTHRL